VVAH